MLRTDLIRPLPELLSEHARVRPDVIAFADDHRADDYAALARNTAALAGNLQRLGLEPGDRVLLYLDNSVDTVEAYLGVPRANGIAVCVNPASAPPEVAHVLADSGARFVITDAAHADTARSLVGDDVQVFVGTSVLREPTDMRPRDSLSEDDPAWMLYTSGTTGRPKGVHLTQRGCLWVVAACFAPILGVGPGEVLLSPLPLFHSYALVLCVLAVAATGASERILPRFSVDAVLHHLREPGPEGPVTVFPGVPTMFQYLLDRAGDAELGIRVAMSAGAIMPAALNTQFEATFGVPLLDGYGITETSTMVTMNWPTGARVMGSCGLPLPGLTVRLVDPATLHDVLPGEEGELWVQGPNVTPGYHNLPDATAAVLVDGWYRTGDLGRRDEHGYLRISGRTKELIIRGGENVYPAEVEDALLASDEVADAAVVGTSHPGLGEVPVGFVVPRDPESFDAEKVLAGCRERLSSFKVPVELVVTDDIPRTGSRKILRFRLQQRLTGESS